MPPVFNFGTEDQRQRWKFRQRRQFIADAARNQRLCREAHRQIGAERQPDPRQSEFVDIELPQARKAVERGRRVARAAADTGSDRQVLLQPDGDGQRPLRTSLLAQGLTRLHHQIVAIERHAGGKVT